LVCFSFNSSTWQTYNNSDPDQGNYSILNLRNYFVSGTTYTLRLTVGNGGDWQSGLRAHTTVWKQNHDPFTQTTDGSDYVYISGDQPTTCGGFNGLHNKYQGNSYTSDPDSNDSIGCWWMQIAPNTNYNNNGYLEGYGGGGNYHIWQVLWYR